jgi:ribose transport system substrate-binding protein
VWSTPVVTKKLTIALIPGLTTDNFYITMRKGAELAAKGLGVELMFQGAPDFNPTLQVPVLNAVIAKKTRCDPDCPNGQAATDFPVEGRP